MEQLAVDTTELGSIDARDTDASLLVADHLGAELEQGTATVDREIDAGAGTGGHCQREVERSRVDRQLIAVAAGLDAIDRRADVRARGTRSGGAIHLQATAKRVVWSIAAQHLDAHEGIRAVRGGGQLQRSGIVRRGHAGRIAARINGRYERGNVRAGTEAQHVGASCTRELKHDICVKAAGGGTASQCRSGRRGVRRANVIAISCPAGNDRGVVTR